MTISPILLEGQHVRLEPLAESHHAGLTEVGLDAELWRLIPYRVVTAQDMLAYIRTALALQKAGTALAFATIERSSGRVIGSTRYLNMAPPDLRVEIGATWLAAPWQRTPINTEAKYLMLRHAFETWGCNRVELKTDVLNARSRAAILRLGAKEEGTFRKHVRTWSGRVRDSVYFSIIDTEWPGVKAALESKLQPRG